MANLQAWHEFELSCSSDIDELLEKLVWVRLTRCKDKLLPARTRFHWNDAFFEELKVLRKAGGRGYIVLFDEYGSYYKYVLDEHSVKSYAGKVIFEGDVPESIALTEEDLSVMVLDMGLSEGDHNYLKGRLGDLSELVFDTIMESCWKKASGKAAFRLLSEYGEYKEKCDEQADK